MKNFFYISLFIIFVSAVFSSAEASDNNLADRFFKSAKNSKMSATPIELKEIDVNTPLYASYWGDSGTLGIGSLPIPTCFYDWTRSSVSFGLDLDDAGPGDEGKFKADAEEVSSTEPFGLKIQAPLVVNNFMTSGKSRQILFGIEDAKYCPLPGSTIFAGYNASVSGEFLLSGAICVVNSILFDAMFKIYCSIIIWFYSLMYAMIIIYIMFYGMALMLGIGQDPVREAPKKVLKIVILFMLVTNAQIGFRYVHSFFITVLNSFSTILTESQTMYDDAGQSIYEGRFNGFSTTKERVTNLDTGVTEDVERQAPDTGGKAMLGMFDNEGELLNLNGTPWRPIDLDDPEVKKVFIEMGLNKPTIPGKYGTPVKASEYVPYRMPAMQWQYDKFKARDANGDRYMMYQIMPVFRPLLKGSEEFTRKPVPGGTGLNAEMVQLSPVDPEGVKYCALDFKNAPRDDIGRPDEWSIRPYLRCPRDNATRIPEFLPYGIWCEYDTRVVVNYSNRYSSGSGKPIIGCYSDKPISTRPIVLDNTKGNYTEECDHFVDSVFGILDSTIIGNLNALKLCRENFQGVLGRFDTVFSAFIGGDRSYGVAGLIGALVSWGVGGGLFLAIFMLLGFFTMSMVSMQLIWTFVTAIMSLSLLLMISPIFIACLLFKTTEKLFRGWLNALISYTLQPFLVMAFIFFLSILTPDNRIMYLIKEELTNKQNTILDGGLGGRISFATGSIMGKSFVEPLYEKPTDFDQFYYKDGKDRSASNPKGIIVYIDGKQRAKYVEEKSEKVLDDFFILHPKFFDIKDTSQAYQANIEQLPPEAQIAYQQIKNLWKEGIFPVAIGSSTKTNLRGLRAIKEFSWWAYYYGGSFVPPGGQTAPTPIPEVKAYFDSIYGRKVLQEIEVFWGGGGCFTSACNISIPHIGLTNSCVTYGWGGCTSGNFQRGFVPANTFKIDDNGYTTTTSISDSEYDDGDALIGEHEDNMRYDNLGANGAYRVWLGPAEFPRCMKFCPNFTPRYLRKDKNAPTDPTTKLLITNKPYLANPRLDVASTQFDDGTQCPYYNISNGTECNKVDRNSSNYVPFPSKKWSQLCVQSTCNKWKCENYCMSIKNGHKQVYRDLFTSILLFIILNAIAAAMMSKVPEIAQALSSWAPGQQAVRIGGGSKMYGREGGDKWTQQEMSEVYHAGGLMSIDPKRPGVFLGAFNNASMILGTYKEIDSEYGRIVTKKGPGILNLGGILKQNPTALANMKANTLERVLLSFGIGSEQGLKGNGTIIDFQSFKDKSILFSSEKDFNKFSTNLEQFLKNRPANATGLKHADIWDAISRVISNPAYNNEQTMKQAILSAIMEKVQEKMSEARR